MKKNLLLVLSLLILLLAISSCNQLQARPETEALIRRQAQNIAELDARCKGGDMEACKGCSDIANKTFEQLINALDGKAGD